MAAQTVYERMYALASSNITPKKAGALAELLEDVKSSMDEIGEIIDEFVNDYEVYSDSDNDREDRSAAKESLDSIVNYLISEFGALVDAVYGEGSVAQIQDA